MRQVATEFKQALQLYFSDPDNKDYLSRLVLASYYLYKFAFDECKKNMGGTAVLFTENGRFTDEGVVLDPGTVIPTDRIDLNIPESADVLNKINAILEQCSLNSIKITQATSQKMQRLIKSLPESEDSRVRQAFDPINMAHVYFFSKNFISAQENKVRSQLFALRQFIDKAGTINTTNTTKAVAIACDQLAGIVDQHFSLSLSDQKANYPVLVKQVNDIFSESKKMIVKDSWLKKIVINFVAAVAGLGVFYGLYLIATATKRNTFFLQPADVLSATKEMGKVQDHVLAAQEMGS